MKVAIVTGSSSGIGAATAIELSRRGWRVVVNFSRSREKAEQTLKNCAEAIAVQADVGEDADCRRLAQAARGAVVNISSLAALLGTGSSIAYAASKAALNTLTLSLARVLGPEVRVNAVQPGFVETPWLAGGYGSERYAEIAQRYAGNAPLNAVCKPEDIADAVAWLIEGARQVTGETLLVDSGFHLATPR